MMVAGLTPGAFYRHFTSKDDLMAEATAVAYRTFEEETQGKSLEALLTPYI